MDQIGNIHGMQDAGQHLQKQSGTGPIVEAVERVIPREKARAMGDVFDRWRLNQGWNPWDNETQMAAIASWVCSLDREDVPAGVYGELYERVLRTRAAGIQAGRSLPAFGVELMVAEWVGEYGLRNEIRQRGIDAGRTLAQNAAGSCQRCDGLEAGLENLYDEQGNRIGVKKGCDHRPIVEGEGIWIHFERRRAAGLRVLPSV